MAIKIDALTANAMLDAYETHIGVSPILELRTGAPPATAATADSGTLVASMTLPSDWMAAASAGSKSKSGTWEDTVADNAGTVGHFRLKTSGAVVKHQGTVTLTGGGGDMTMDNNVLTAGQASSITTFTINMTSLI